MNMCDVKMRDVDDANVHVEALWKVHDMKSRSPEKFMNVRNVKLPHENFFCLAHE